MSADLHDFWHATLQVNTYHTGKLLTTLYVSCTPLTWWRNVDVIEITLYKWHCHIATERNSRVYHPEMWPHNLTDLYPLHYSVWGILILQRRSIIHGSIMWSSWKNICWGSGGQWTTLSSRQWLCSDISDLSANVHVNDGHFDHRFCICDFLVFLFVLLIMVCINVIDINMCSVLSLHKMCYICVWDFYTVC